MSYLRWSGSDWYVFAHCDGGLAVWSRHDHDDTDRIYSTDEIRAFLSGEQRLEEIPGWRDTSTSERQTLLWAMREYVADESDNPENLYQIGDGNYSPSMRQLMRRARTEDREPPPFGPKKGDA